jgi:TrpR family trp operon transcriptional repressor
METMKYRDEFVDVLCRLADRARMKRFLDEVMTEAERRDLGLRWRLMRMLASGMPQREVAAQLGISLCKITRGSRILKRRGSVCRMLMEEMENDVQA